MSEGGNRGLRWLGGAGLACLLLCVAGGAWLYLKYQAFAVGALPIPAQGIIYEVNAGAPLRAIAHDLESRGLIDHAEFLVWMGRREKLDQRIRAGEFRVPAGTTPAQFLRILVEGPMVQYSLTIVEGWTFRQMMEAVRGHEKIEQRLAGLSDAEIMAALGHEGEHPEGRFYPDTYLFPRGTTDMEFLKRSYRLMQQRLAAEWEARAPGLPLESPYQALILASIVERETGVPAERRQVAGVFVRRLKRGMRLQTDPTVIYGLGDRYDGDIRFRDLRTDTPYNTYTRAGLPPTPIALPGGASIHAALHPDDGKALYFVARGDGSHVFSATLSEHNAAVRKYQMKRRKLDRPGGQR